MEQVTRDVAKAQEAYIQGMMDALGISIEELVANYILEQYPPKTEFYVTDDYSTVDRFRVKAVQEFRLRLKTEQEKEQERQTAKMADDEMYLP